LQAVLPVARQAKSVHLFPSEALLIQNPWRKVE
jgi:hypothetical protein